MSTDSFIKLLDESDLRIRIVMASNDEGIRIKELHEQMLGSETMFDWNDIYPYWLVAKDKSGTIVGAIQVLPGKPVGHIEMAMTDTSMKSSKRLQVYWRLVFAAINVLKLHGTKMAFSLVPFDKKGIKRFAKKHGWEVADSGNLMAVNIQ